MSIFILNKKSLVGLILIFVLLIGLLTLALNSLSALFRENHEQTITNIQEGEQTEKNQPEPTNSSKADEEAASTGRKIPIYSVETSEKLVALTFNCAWGNEDIPDLLTLLNEHEIRATFFFVGDWVENYPESVEAIFKAGHSIGNHSDKHPDMTKLDSAAIKEDIHRCNEKIEGVTGQKTLYFRAPSGAYDDKTISAAESLSMLSVQWDVDSIDWRDPSPDEIISRVLGKVKNGSIVLFHSGKKNTYEALPRIIEGLKNEGFSFAALDELIIKKNFHIDNNGRQQKSS